MQGTKVALSDKALAYLKKKNIRAISVDTLEQPSCGFPGVINESVSKGAPKKEQEIYKKQVYEGIDVYFPYYTNVDSQTIHIDCERFLGYTRLFVANAIMEY
ncbi:hypothetical protein [Aedoeadaptatus coxii]|uniref:hypothetical protein n=1 Tax=Aedoeadaptatus coxii TaxID=755172 RepID=UPI002AD2E75A|nr:hypothetical protein [Peptoniphilus coxii]